MIRRWRSKAGEEWEDVAGKVGRRWVLEEEVGAGIDLNATLGPWALSCDFKNWPGPAGSKWIYTEYRTRVWSSMYYQRENYHLMVRRCTIYESVVFYNNFKISNGIFIFKVNNNLEHEYGLGLGK